MNRAHTGFAFVIGLALSAADAAGQGQSRPFTNPVLPGRYGAIGCLTRQGTAVAPRYVITDTRGPSPTVYRLDGDRSLLERHVGHTIEVSGTLTPVAGSSRHTMKVSSLVWIASSCRK
jgi:hypothetical protein